VCLSLNVCVSPCFNSGDFAVCVYIQYIHCPAKKEKSLFGFKYANTWLLHCHYKISDHLCISWWTSQEVHQFLIKILYWQSKRWTLCKVSSSTSQRLLMNLRSGLWNSNIIDLWRIIHYSSWVLYEHTEIRNRSETDTDLFKHCMFQVHIRRAQTHLVFTIKDLSLQEWAEIIATLTVITWLILLLCFLPKKVL